MKPDTIIAPMLLKLKECMCNYLNSPETTPLGGPLCQCCVVWSDQIFMDGCDCECSDGSRGRAYIRFVSAASIQRERGCPGGMNVTIELGIMRCYTPTETVPPCDSLEMEAMIGLADLRALRRIVSCCNALPKRYTVDEMLPVGPQGGCYGATMRVTFATNW